MAVVRPTTSEVTAIADAVTKNRIPMNVLPFQHFDVVIASDHF
jgi:hypothetical protein